MQCSFLGMAAVVAVGWPSISRFIHTDRCARTRYSELALDRTVTDREFFPMRTRTLSDIAVASRQSGIMVLSPAFGSRPLYYPTFRSYGLSSPNGGNPSICGSSSAWGR